MPDSHDHLQHFTRQARELTAAIPLTHDEREQDQLAAAAALHERAAALVPAGSVRDVLSKWGLIEESLVGAGEDGPEQALLLSIGRDLRRLAAAEQQA